MSTKIYASGVIFEDDGEILVLRRHAKGREGDTWGLVGGNIEPGEDKLDAAIREVDEEIGHNIRPSELEFLKTYRWDRDDFDITFEVFKYKIHRNEVNIDLDTDENVDHMWAQPKDLITQPDLMRGLYPILEDEYINK